MVTILVAAAFVCFLSAILYFRKNGIGLCESLLFPLRLDFFTSKLNEYFTKKGVYLIICGYIMLAFYLFFSLF